MRPEITLLKEKKPAFSILSVAIATIAIVSFCGLLVKVGFQETNRGTITLSPGIITQLVVSPSEFDLESGQTKTLTATLTFAAGAPLVGKTVNWSADYGEVSPESGVTDGAGQISVTYTAPVTDQDLSDIITAVFAGDAQFQGSSGYSTGNIISAGGITPIQTQLVISPSSFTLESGKSRTLTATLTVGGAPLAGKTISLSAGLGEVISGNGTPSGTTDSYGQLSITYTAPTTDDAVLDSITAVFAGDAQYLGSSGYSTGNITPRAQTQLVISPSSFTLRSGQSMTLTATLTADDTPLVGKTINWSADYGEVSPESGTTNSSGQVSVTYTAPVTDQNLSDNITAVFAGDAQFQGSSGYSTGNITPRAQTQLVISPIWFTLQSGQSTILTATLTSENAALVGRTISWYAGLGGFSLGSGMTDNAGQVSVTYTAPTTDYGLWDNILAQFAGDNQYKESFGPSIVHVTVLDTDNDNMPDSWENKYELDPENPEDAAQDKDGDSYTNVQEYLAGTDPNLSSSYPGAEEEVPSTEGIFLVVAGALVAVGLISSVVLIGTLHTRGEAVSILLENGLLNMRVKEVDMFRRIRQLKEFTVSDLMRETHVSRVFAWRTLQKLIEKGLVQPSGRQKPSSNGLGGRGKPNTIYKYVGK